MANGYFIKSSDYICVLRKMKNIKAILLTLFLLSGSLVGFSQKIEIGASIYGAQYNGDLRQGYSKSVGFGSFFGETMDYLKYGGGPMFRINYSSKFALRGSLNYAYLVGSDKFSADDENGKGRKLRNLDFHTNILQLSAVGEYNFFSFGWGRYLKKFTPFVMGGVSMFHFNPKTEYKGQTYELQPLGTEGQGLIQYPDKNKYALTQFALPVGGGFKFALSKSLRLTLEYMHNFSSTDYLDDVSGSYADYDLLYANNGPISANLGDRRNEINPALPKIKEGQVRGNPKKKDSFIYTGFTLSYVLFENNCPSFKR